MSRMSDANTSGQAGNVGESVRDAASQVQQNVRDIGGQVRDAAQEKLGQLRAQASQYYEEGRQRAMQWEEGLEGYIQEKPIRSLLIAAGVGVIVGFLWRRS